MQGPNSSLAVASVSAYGPAVLAFQPVPEPSALALLVVGAFGIRQQQLRRCAAQLIIRPILRNNSLAVAHRPAQALGLVLVDDQ
jgi:hypothetical protein